MSIISFDIKHKLVYLKFKFIEEFDPKPEIEDFINWFKKNKATSAIVDVNTVSPVGIYKSKYVDTVLSEATELEYEFLFTYTISIPEPDKTLYIIGRNCTQEKWTPFVVTMGLLAERLLKHNLIEPLKENIYKPFRKKQKN